MMFDSGGLPIRDLVTDFESLGDNCELGIVQRAFGAEPLGLLRWAGINHIDILIRALNNRFVGLGEIENVAHDMLEGWDHHAAIDKKFGFYFHTDLDPSAVADQPEEMHKLLVIEGRRLRFLAEKLIEVLKTGDKILVYRQKRELQQSQIDQLFSAISQYGRNTLLLVVESASCQPGTIEIRKPRLIFGYVGRLSNENPPQIEFDSWRRIIESAHQVWRTSRRDSKPSRLHEVPIRGIFDRTLSAAPDSLLAGFESLGHGPEFGIAQRFVGIETSSLLRFSTLPHEALMALLANGFSDLAESDGISLFHRQDGEFFVRVARYGLEYQTGIYVGEFPEGEVIARERSQLKMRKQRMLETLAAGDKILLRFDDEVSEQDMRALHRALGVYGQSRLLWVDKAPVARMAGTIEQIEPGLVRGFVMQRSPHAAPTPHGLSIWLKIALDGRDLLAREENRSFIGARGMWVVPNEATAVVNDQADGASFGQLVLQHELTVDTNAHNGNILSYDIRFDMKPNALYTISAWVWIPSGFVGSNVAMAAVGFPSIHGWAADLSHRDQWQHIVTSFRQPVDQVAAAPSLMVIGQAGSTLFSTGWRLDEGAVPASYFL